MALEASPSSQHQHCTDEAQKAKTVLSAVIYIHILHKLFTRYTDKMFLECIVCSVVYTPSPSSLPLPRLYLFDFVFIITGTSIILIIIVIAKM